MRAIYRNYTKCIKRRFIMLRRYGNVIVEASKIPMTNSVRQVKKKAGEEDKANKANEILTGVEAEWKDKGLDLLKVMEVFSS